MWTSVLRTLDGGFFEVHRTNFMGEGAGVIEPKIELFSDFDEFWLDLESSDSAEKIQKAGSF